MASPFNQYNLGLFDSGTYIPFVCNIASVTPGSTTFVTTMVDHGFVVGNQVQFFIPQQYGMTQLNAQKGYVLSVPDADEIEVSINSIGFNSFSIPVVPMFVVIDPAQVSPVGDQNTGLNAVNGQVPIPQTTPGANYNIPP